MIHDPSAVLRLPLLEVRSTVGGVLALLLDISSSLFVVSRTAEFLSSPVNVSLAQARVHNFLMLCYPTVPA
jgi:hypothetical protein